MKKIQYLLTACGLLLAGCSETPGGDAAQPAPAPVKYVSLRISAAAGTRAGLDGDLRVKFRPGDMIDINGRPIAAAMPRTMEKGQVIPFLLPRDTQIQEIVVHTTDGDQKMTPKDQI